METALGPCAKYVVSLMYSHLSTPPCAYSRDVVIVHGLELPLRKNNSYQLLVNILC